MCVCVRVYILRNIEVFYSNTRTVLAAIYYVCTCSVLKYLSVLNVTEHCYCMVNNDNNKKKITNYGSVCTVRRIFYINECICICVYCV